MNYLSLDRVGNVEMTPSTFIRIRFGLLGFKVCEPMTQKGRRMVNSLIRGQMAQDVSRR